MYRSVLQLDSYRRVIYCVGMALNPGEDSIGDCKVTTDPTTGVKYLRWSIKLPNGKLKNPRTQAPAGTSNGEVKRRARAKAAEMIRLSGTTGTWKPGSPVTEYIKKVSKPAVDKAKIRDSSKTRYKQLLDLLAETRFLGGYTIADATRFRNLETALVDLAAERGRESGRQARNVTSKYLLQQLIRDELLDHNPLHGMTIDLGDVRTRKRVAGGQALTGKEYDKVVSHLLKQTPGKDDGLTLARSLDKRRSVIDLTLLQATTGLRITEARTLTWDNVEVDGDGQMHVTVTEEISKTHRARTVPVLDERVQDHLLTRRNTIGGRYVVGAPGDPDTEWDRANALKAVKKLYIELSTDLAIPLLHDIRSHVWRATLNTLLIELPEVHRAAYFGHDESVNRTAYTDTTDTTAMVTAARRRHLNAV